MDDCWFVVTEFGIDISGDTEMGILVDSQWDEAGNLFLFDY